MERFKKILDENKSLKILGPVLLVAVIAMVIMWTSQKPATKPTGSTGQNQSSQVDITPTSVPTSIPGETDTNFSPGTDDESEIVSEDSSLIGPPEYKGALRDASGAFVLLQFSNVTKHVRIGESIAGYKIKSLADDDSNITIEKDNLITVLQISPNSN